MTKSRGSLWSLLIGTGGVLASSGAALAHHPMGGQTPDTLLNGVLSGIGHPIIGMDHLAFVICVGLAAAFVAGRYVTPLAFSAATVAGCAAMLSGIALPYAEIVITGSVVVLGALILTGRSLPVPALVGLFAVAGLFHGSAYGAAIVGAETTPLAGYLIAFAATQYAIAIAAGWVATAVWKAADASALKPRLAGALMAGVGFAFLVENVEGMMF
jgi:urease accessory protein